MWTNVGLIECVDRVCYRCVVGVLIGCIDSVC